MMAREQRGVPHFLLLVCLLYGCVGKSVHRVWPAILQYIRDGRARLQLCNSANSFCMVNVIALLA